MYACNGVLFNHESPRRGETFVTADYPRLGAGKRYSECLYMGNLDSLRDWGHARDYVTMQWLMLQQEKPEDFVIATGREVCAALLGCPLRNLDGGQCNGKAKVPMKWVAVVILVL